MVFVDLVGFTARAERLDPEDVHGVLSPYQDRVRAELERYGGTVEKFIGDAVVALFGAPIAHEDDPERAVRAALAVREWVAQQPDLHVRMAVNTGEALVVLGARVAQGDHIASGDVLNTAARLQAAAPVNGVLVGEATQRATRDAIRYRAALPVQAKGKVDPIVVWEALEPVARLGIDVQERPRTPLVGRDRELDLLGSILARVREERSAQLVTLVGVPGIGKSRLVTELSQEVDRTPELITWRQGRCLPYGEPVTFWALGEIIKSEAGILESDTPAEAAEKLHAAVGSAVHGAAERRWMETELRLLVGLAGEGSQAGGAETATAAWRRFLEAAAERRATVLVFEDLHWADEGLLDFLDELVDWLRDVPLLVVGTARPELLERRQHWGGGKANSTTISLQPLADDDTARLIAALLERPLQLAAEQRTLLERAGGNPLFAEQYVRMLGERGTTGELPESLQGVIAARLDALPRAEKDLLQEAAVHGKTFWVGGVATASGISAADAARLLHALERKDFVRRERRSAVAEDAQYSFQHVLLRDVAYGQLPRRARSEKHRSAAEWIAGLGRPDDHAELLAFHYEQALELARAAGIADDPALIKRARESLLAAGERALALSAYASAAEFLAKALVLAPRDDPRRPRMLLQRGRALFPLSGAGLDLLNEALDGFRAAGDAEGEAKAAATAARIAWFAGDRAATDRYIAEALEAVAGRRGSRARVLALTHQSGFHMLGGRYQDSIRVGAEALPLAEELGMEEQRARLHIVVGTARDCLGDRGGLDEIKTGIRVAEAAGSAEMVENGYVNLSAGFHMFARLAEAREGWRQAIELGERLGLRLYLRSTRAEGVGWPYLEGRWDEALSIAGELTAAIDAGDRHFTDAFVLTVRGWIQLARGDTAAADLDTARAAELARASDVQAQSQAYCIRAATALTLGRRQEADQLASELAAMGTTMLGGLCVPFPNLTDIAWVFRDLGRERELSASVLDPNPIKGPWHDAARAILNGELVRAAEVIEGIGHMASAAYARLRAAEALAAAGQHAQAATQRLKAEAFYRNVGAVQFLRVCERLANAPMGRRSPPLSA